MRTFYIFKINDEFSILTKDSPYNLYKTMEQIYHLNKKNLNLAFKMFEKLAIPFNKESLNKKILELYNNNDNYIKFDNVHVINNYYTDEQTKLVVNKSHLLINTSINTPVFFKDLRTKKNLFVCDFQNKDYFWLQDF